MENGGTKSPPEQLLASHVAPVDARWLTANIEEVNLSYNQILDLIENRAEMFADKSDACYEKQCQLIAHVEEILHKHQTLAEQYKHLRSSNNSSAFHQQKDGDAIIGSIEFSNELCFQTPENNKAIGHHVNPEVPSNVSFQMSGGGSSDISGKGSSRCSATSSDSDFEIYERTAYKSARSHIDSHRMLEHHFVDKEEVDGTDEGQFRRMLNYEEELSLSRKKLHLSESEVSRLQKELKELTGTFESQLNSSQNELEKRDIAFEMEKKKVVVLQNQVASFENQVLNSNTKIGSLEMELDLAKLKLESSEEEITNLKSCLNKDLEDSTELKNQLELAQQKVAVLAAKLDGEKRQTLEMWDKIHLYEPEITKRDDRIQELKTVLNERTDKSRENELQLQSHISSLIDNLMLVEASSNKWENRCKSLKEQLQQCEAAMSEMRRRHEVQETRWKTDIDLLKTELNEKVVSVKILNNDLDTLKQKRDILEAELDAEVVSVEILSNDLNTLKRKRDTLQAELGSKEVHILQMEGRLHKLHLENVEMTSASASALQQYEDVRLKLKDLEKEVQIQRSLVLDRAEEKREAIRQLCFTIEYYRNRYEELLQAGKGLKY